MNDPSPLIIDKIKKLLSLSESPNENEAALAMEKVYRLLAKYELSVEEVQGEVNSIQQLAFQSKSRSAFYERYLRLVVADVYKVGLVIQAGFKESPSGYIRQNTFYFVGKRHQIEVAKYVHDFLYELIKKKWGVYKKGLGKLPRKLLYAHKRGYWCGFSEAVYKNLKKKIEGMNEQEGLVLVKDPEIDEYTRNFKRAPALKEQTVMNVSYLKGFELGMETDVNPACESGEQLAALES